MTPFWRRARAAEEAAARALSATVPEGWDVPEARMDWAAVATWQGSGSAKVSVSADQRRGHAGEIVVRATLRKPRELVLIATAATVERDLVAAFKWAMDNLMESQNATSKA